MTTAPPVPPSDRERLQRRTARVMLTSQVVAGAGLAAGVTVGALLAEDMLGSARFSGIASTLFTLGSAATAYSVGALSDRRGRRAGLGAGYLAATLGALGAVVAAALGSVVLLFAALAVYGAGSATNLQARYAGGDLAPASGRGRAISTVLLGTTVGAVAGPNLVAPAGQLAERVGLPPLAGPFAMAALAYAAAGLVITVWLRPDPLLTARRLVRDEPSDVAQIAGPVRTDRAAVRLGGLVMVMTQLVMVAIMTMTPIHMQAHGHGLGAVGLVISIHVCAMFLPSLVTGGLVDRVGRVPMAAASGVTLLLAGVVGALAPGDSLLMLVLSLSLLGLGWNFGLIAGTALIVDATPTATRARTQGSVDVLIALSGAGGGALSGAVVAGSSFATLALAGGLLALLLVPTMAVYRRHVAGAAAVAGN